MQLPGSCELRADDAPPAAAATGLSFSPGLACWAAQAPRSWPAAAIEAAERAVAVTVGCIVAGSLDEAVRKVVASLGAWGGGGRSSAVGMRDRIDAPWAALVNGTAAHALDYDDVLESPATHPSAVLVSALLALAEETGAAGRT